MQFTSKWVPAAVGLMVACASTAYAGQEVSVGRVDLQLPGGDEAWQVYRLDDAGIDIAGQGVSFHQKAETKLLVRRTPDRVIDAAFIVRANVSGKGRFSGLVFSEASCTGGSGVFADGDEPGPAAHSFRCLLVTVPHDVTGQQWFPHWVQEPLAKDGWTWPRTMQLVIAKQYANTGAYVDITAFVRPELLPAVADQDARDGAVAQPEIVTAASLKWGRLLQEAATDSVYSIRGKLPVPELAIPGEGDGTQPVAIR